MELFEPDFLGTRLSPRELRRYAADLGLAIDLYQPFRDFEGVSDERLARNLERAERKFDLMEALGVPLGPWSAQTSPRQRSTTTSLPRCSYASWRSVLSAGQGCVRGLALGKRRRLRARVVDRRTG